MAEPRLEGVSWGDAGPGRALELRVVLSQKEAKMGRLSAFLGLFVPVWSLFVSPKSIGSGLGLLRPNRRSVFWGRRCCRSPWYGVFGWRWVSVGQCWEQPPPALCSTKRPEKAPSSQLTASKMDPLLMRTFFEGSKRAVFPRIWCYCFCFKSEDRSPRGNKQKNGLAD